MTSLVLRTAHQQQHAISPRLQHAVRLLQLSSLEFAQEIRVALGRNPFLEGDEEAEGDAVAPAAAVEAEGWQGDAAPYASEPPLRSEDERIGIPEQEGWQTDVAWPKPAHVDGDVSSLDLMACSTALSDHLHLQLNVLPLSPRDMALAKAVVEALDEDGYLRIPVTEVVAAGDLDPAPSEAELEIAVRRVQALDPCGVGARSVAECLRLQLPSILDEATRSRARHIVDGHLDLLASRDLSALARVCDCTLAEASRASESLRRLDPRPGWRYSTEPTRYITPDVVLRKVKDQWRVALNPSIAPRVRFNERYAELFLAHRAGAQHAELSAHLQEARWTLRNIEQRFSTILGVAQQIVKRQRHFFEYGDLAMKPMGLRDVAEELGIHESTVSRVTSNKFMATPRGVFELKFFFSRALCTEAGRSCSGTAIRGLIHKMIESEAADRPLSDAEIARRLTREGLVVARRTVTNYRQQLRIESVERRRRVC